MYGMRRPHEVRRRRSPQRRMASVQDFAVLVRYFMSAAVRPQSRFAPIPSRQQWRRSKRLEPSRTRSAHQTLPARTSSAREACFAVGGSPNPSCSPRGASPSDESALAPCTKPIASPANLPASSFNPASTRSATVRTLLKYRNGVLMAQAYHGQRRRQHLSDRGVDSALTPLCGVRLAVSVDANPELQKAGSRTPLVFRLSS
jgi:hypothetical protein